MLNIYVAAPWDMKSQARTMSLLLKNAGHAVTSTWLNEPDGNHSAIGHHLVSDLETIAQQDVDDLDAADTLVLLSGGRTPRVGGGRHFEFGYSYAKGKTIVIFGIQEHVFWHIPNPDQIHLVNTLSELFDVLGVAAGGTWLGQSA